MSSLQCLINHTRDGNLNKEQERELIEILTTVQRDYISKKGSSAFTQSDLEAQADEAIKMFSKSMSASAYTKWKQLEADIRNAKLLREHYADDAHEGAMGLFGLETHKERVPYFNVEYRSKGHQAKMSALLGAKVKQFMPSLIKTMRLFANGLDPNDVLTKAQSDDMIKLNRQVYNAYRGIDKSNTDANQIADAVREVVNYARNKYIEFGGVVGKLDNWHPQNYSVDRIAGVTDKQFVTDAMRWIDRAKMVDITNPERLLNDAEIQELLEGMYKHVTSGQAHLGGEFAGGALWRQHAGMRKLHWSDEGWWEFNEKYGASSFMDSINDYVHSEGELLGRMEVFGPNWNKGVDNLKTVVTDLMNKNGQAQEVANVMSQINLASDMYTGIANSTTSRTVSNFFANARSVTSASMLGSAVLTAIPSDLSTSIRTAWFNKLPAYRQLRLFWRGVRQDPNIKAVAADLGLTADVLINNYNIYTGGRVAGGKQFTKAWADATFRLTGMTQATHAQREAMGLLINQKWAKESSKTWDQLTPFDQDTLKVNRITPEKWELIRTLGVYEHPQWKNRVISPTQLMRSGNRLADEAATDFTSFIAMEMEHAAMTGGHKTQRIIKQYLGNSEWVKMMMQFKAPILQIPLLHMGWEHGRGGFIGKRVRRRGQTSAAVYQGSIMAMLLMAGIVSTQSREVLAGRDPLAMDEAELWAQAITRSGALGGLTEAVNLLVSGSQPFDSSTLLSYAAGPVPTQIYDTLDNLVSMFWPNKKDGFAGNFNSNARQLVDRLANYIPLTNLWYIKNAKERLLMDWLESEIDPQNYKNIRRRINRNMKERDQEEWWRSSTSPTLPSRAPDMSKIWDVGS